MNRTASFYRRWFSLIALSGVLLAIVGYASDETSGLLEVSVASMAVLVTAFHFLFGASSGFFNIVFANGLTLYLCFFSFFVETLFSRLPGPVLAEGFIMPLAAFLGGAVYWRRDILRILLSEKKVQVGDLARAFFWLLPLVIVGVAAFAIHEESGLPPESPSRFFLSEMAAISCIVGLASRDFVVLLVDTGRVFKNFFSSNAELIKPMFAFFTFYSLNVVVFASLYRIISHVSGARNFMMDGHPHVLTFVESVYFSLVTVSTTGYGDIIPATNAVRFLVGLQTVTGTLLFFFGVHAVLSHEKK